MTTPKLRIDAARIVKSVRIHIYHINIYRIWKLEQTTKNKW